MGMTTTGTLTEAQKTYYLDRFLSHFTEAMVANQFAQSVPLPDGEGKTVDWFRYHPLAKVTTASSESITSYTYQAPEGMAITATVEIWDIKKPIQFSMLHYKTSRDRYLTKMVDLVSDNAAESLERNSLYTLAETGIFPLVGGAVNSAGTQNAAYLNEDIAVSSPTSTTVLTLVNTSLSLKGKNGSQTFKGGWVCITRGAAYGHCCRISAYSSTTRQITLATALPEAAQSPTNNYPTKLTIAAPFSGSSCLLATHIISTALLNKAAEILRKNKAQRFPNGKYILIVTPEVHTQLLNDSKFRDTAVNSPNFTNGGYQNSKVKEWADFDIFETTCRARYATVAETVNSFSETTGRMRMSFALGMDAFGTVDLSGRAEPELFIKMPTADDNNTSNPLNAWGTMAWKKYWKVKSLNANFCVGIMTYV